MNFRELQSKYANVDKGNIKNLHKQYSSRKADSLLDSMMAAIGVSTLFDGNTINLDAVTPQMREAFELAFPTKSFQDLEGLSSEQIQGIVSNWKGKLFEVQVRDQLNNGEIVGDVVLEDGQYVELAETINQEGWDLQIFNADGSVNEFLQLKATESMSYINEALGKYPDIDILATSEIAELSNELQNSGISIDGLNEPLTNVLEANDEILDMVVPGLPFLIIAASEGRKVFVKKSDWDSSIENIATRGVKTGLAMGAGWLAFDFTGIGWLGVAASFGFRRLIDYMERDEKIDKILPLIAQQNKEIILLQESYE